jgi:glycosyltransferase involved in cell wall biosynthesis
MIQTPLKFSIVTPSYNQGSFLGQTIESVISQNVDFEYVVIDGGSSDQSIDIIKRYASHLHYWCSEADEGQYAAINKGFSKTSGEIMGWLNSSDLYFNWTLPTVLKIFTLFPEVKWITSLQKICLDESGAIDGVQRMRGFGAQAFFQGRHGGPQNSNFIQQEATFWRRSLWEEAGGRIPEESRFAADFHLWGNFFQRHKLYGLDCPLAGFRVHGEARSASKSYLSEVNSLLEKWSELELSKIAPKGFSKITKHWNKKSLRECRGYWQIESIHGNELLQLPEEAENAVLDIFYKIYCFSIELYYRIEKLFYFMVRLLLWPVRKKSPLSYK